MRLRFLRKSPALRPVFLFLLALACTAAASAQATFTITTLTDAATGVAAHCTNQAVASAPDASCSLRDALAASAALNSPAGTTPVLVNFAPSLAAVGNPGTLSLTGGFLGIPSYTTVQGLTAGTGTTLTNLITIQGNGQTAFFVGVGVAQTALKNLVITKSAPAVNNSGTLTISQCTFAQNAATSGAAIYSDGTLTVLSSTFTGNTATSYGAAIYTSGPNYSGPVATAINLTVSGSTFQGNRSATDGGAIYVGRASVAAIDSSTFTGNTAARAGAAIYINNGSGLTRITNSILNGDTGGNECDGVGCSGAVKAWVFAGSQPSGSSERGNITLTLTLSTGSMYTIAVPYGEFSTGDSLPSGFGGTITTQYYPTLSAQGFGNTLVIASQTGTITSAVFTNPSKFYTITPVPDAVISGTGNTVSAGTAANLSALGSFGGPTQTVLPLPGSSALCTITPTAATGTDARGLPRTTTFGTTLCQDSGAVQTNYGLSFVQQPSAGTANNALAPAPPVQLSESGQSLTQANAPVTMKDTAGALAGTRSVATATTGIATFSGLSVSTVQSADILIASVPVGPYFVSVSSNPFDVAAQPTATLSGNATFPLTAYGGSSTQTFTLTNTGTSAITVTALAASPSPEFSSTSTCGVTVAPGASCATVITFKPIATGTRNGSFILRSNATGYTSNISLTGTAAYPTATLTGTATFPDTVINTASPAQSFTVTNTSTVPVTINSIAATGDFAQTNTCGTTLAAGATCTISVVFTPTALGARTGTLRMVSNSISNVPTVSLSGSGVAAPALALADNTTGATTSSITVAAGTTGTATLKLTSVNNFVGAVNLTCAASGTPATGTACSVTSPITLTANGSVTATVTLTTTSRTRAAGFIAWSRNSMSLALSLALLLSATTLGPRRYSSMRGVGGLLLLLVCVTTALTGCGSAPGNATPNPNGTAAGTYTYTVTATGNGVTATQQVVLTVQ